MTHPLANLPRPLDERDRGRRRARRALTLGIAAGVLGAGVFAVATLGGSGMFGMLGPVGGVAGAVATPDAQAVVEVAPAPAATATPAPAAPAVRVPVAIPTPQFTMRLNASCVCSTRTRGFTTKRWSSCQSGSARCCPPPWTQCFS